jgi:hypothetical protein
MAIQVNGCTVIDDGRNIVNANDLRVGLVTITGSSGDIETPGTISAAGVDVPISTVSFDPPDGETDVAPSVGLSITFDQVVVKGTGNITLRSGSAGGTVLQTIGVSSTGVTLNGATVIITPSVDLKPDTNIYVVIDDGAFISANIGSPISLIDTYDFTTKTLETGDLYAGGTVICISGATKWIAAPSSSQISRSWYSRAQAITTAQQVSGRSGWFIPSCAQLQNPGSNCRSFWDGNGTYWSDTRGTPSPSYSNVPMINVNTNTASTGWGGCDRFIRAFRCVTY